MTPSPAGPAVPAEGSEVSRETSGPALPGRSGPSDAAAQWLGERLPGLVRYAELLAGAGVERGLLGPREVPRLWERHLLNCAVVADLVPHGAAVDDVGSGAGLPGMVLALVRPDLRVTLVEPLLRRATFLEEAVRDLGLDERVRVVRERAEQRARGGPTADVVTARAVARLDRLLGWTVPLVHPGGLVLALKGENAAVEVAAAAGVLRRLGVREVKVLTVGADIVQPPTTVVRVIAGEAGCARREKGKRR